MNLQCPSSDELVRWVDGECTANRAAALQAHLRVCSACRAEHQRLGALLDHLAAPSSDLDTERSVQAVMSRLDSARPAPKKMPASGRRLWVPSALAAAAALVLVLNTELAPREDFTARGSGRAAALQVPVELFALMPDPAPLPSDAEISAETPLVAGYRSAEPNDVHLLLFAVDVQGEVHWLYPGYLRPEEDPLSVRLSRSPTTRLLPEAVVLDGVPAGPLQVLSIVSPDPLRVSSIESLPPAELHRGALEARWPEASIVERRLQILSPEGVP